MKDMVGITQLAFLIFKLTGIVDWSWLVTFSPLLIGFGLLIILCAIYGYIC